MAIWFERIELDYGRHAGSFKLIREDVLAALLAPHGPSDAPQGRPGNGANESGNGTEAGNGTSASGRGTSAAGTGAGGLAGAPRPFVILGPNGAGKSTLMEAPVRALFGFRRSRKEGREAHAQRQPWVGGPYRSLVVVGTPQGRLTFERDFETDRIRVTEDGRQSPVFDAEANPSRTGETVRQYREILRETIGLDDFDHYRDTACIFQGGLLAKKLSGDLLRVAAGGHTDVDSAYARLRKEYGPITVEPLAEGIARRRKPGEIERLNEDIDELTLQATEARAAEERRTPLVRVREECAVRLARLGDESERLEAAFETLSDGERLETEIKATRARIRALESSERQLDEALAAFNLLVAREEAHAPRYPEDFAARARVLEEVWPRLAGIDTEVARLSAQSERPDVRTAPVLVGAAAVAVVSLVVVLLGFTGIGLFGLVGGLAGAGFAYSRQRTSDVKATLRATRQSELTTERTGVRDRLLELTRDLPDGSALSPETLPAARREFDREVADRRLHADAEATLRQAIDSSRRAIRLHRIGTGPSAESNGADLPDDESPPAGGSLVDRARARLDELKEAIATERDERMAPLNLQLNEIAKTRFELPADVEPTLGRVRLARRDRVAASAEAQAELASVERELAIEGRVTASALSLDRELAERLDRVSALEARAVAYRHAYAFVADAYDAFRTTDEERLLAAISSHLGALSAGTLGPIEAADGLETATIRSGRKALPLSSPPLSYGQLHAALLSVRMGAADFLAGLGVGLPLLIDDPFVHLDERAVSDLWSVLCRIASDRQVIVATQDRLVLDHLGVSADIELETTTLPAPDTRSHASGSPLESESAPRTDADDERGGGDPGPSPEESRSADPSRVEGEVLDLWGDPEGHTP
ncbi:MAG: AAA family ATPase [Gemmatimonadota bacterium]|nr:AAA family ATPase [Gemmatimonadota bacterium]